VLHVQLTHAGVRHLIATDERISRSTDSSSPRWLEEWGVPINQEDLAGTLLTFSWTVIGGLSALGVPVTEDEAEAYLHAWKVVGTMLGLREELLPDDCADADALSNRIRERQRKPSPEGREMTSALLDMLKESLPGRIVPGFGPSMIRHFIGDAADELGVPEGGRAGSIFRRASLLATASGLTQQHSWALRKTAGMVSRALLNRYAVLDRGGDRPRFEIPQSLGASWPRLPGVRRR
jgi:mpaB/rubber oxygenase-like protein